MRHIELLNSNEVLDTFNDQCSTGDTCYICDVDCSCDTYVCVNICGVECTTCNVCNTCNVSDDPCGIHIC